MCDYDTQTFHERTKDANKTAAVWSLNHNDILLLAQRVAEDTASEEETSLFEDVLLARAVPAEPLKRTVCREAERCTITKPIVHEYEDGSIAISFQVLLFAGDERIGYTINSDSWMFFFDEFVAKFSLWRTPPWELRGAHLRNAQRTRRRKRRRERQREQARVEALHNADLDDPDPCISVEWMYPVRTESES